MTENDQTQAQNQAQTQTQNRTQNRTEAARQRAIQMREMIDQGFSWDQIATMLNRKKTSCQDSYTRMRRRFRGEFPIPVRQHPVKHSNEVMAGWAQRLAAGETYRAIAQELGCTESCILLLLKRRREKHPEVFEGIPTVKEARAQARKAAVTQAQEMRDQGMSLTKIAKALNVPRSTLRVWEEEA